MFFVFLFLAVGSHAIADFPLQNEYMAEGKRECKGLLFWHCFIHAMVLLAVLKLIGDVALYTCFTIGCLELVVHLVMDWGKIWLMDLGRYNESRLNLLDQVAHVGSKIVYAYLLSPVLDLSSFWLIVPGWGGAAACVVAIVPIAASIMVVADRWATIKNPVAA